MHIEDTPSLEHPFMEFVLGESNAGYASDEEKAWLRWVKQVERILGHDIDGNESVEARAHGMSDGYSADGAYAAWEQNISAAEYAAEVEQEKLRLAIQAYGPEAVDRAAFDATIEQALATGRAP